jgi:Glycosyltransferase sugar-binding region containing DXD motif
MDREQYPNMSRLIESFQQSGWEYRFYTDEQVVTFLQTHFPPEVVQAYDALIPGAFKADLFRYCVLLIYGGVYADVDVHLQSALDLSIPDNVGFMVPIDEPGRPVQKQMCVWNGFIASTPSHPFLIKAIETIVNQVRNRYTSVDIDATFCPNPELSLLHAYDTLFTAGPCMLGASINRVLGRNPQTSHVPGELHNVWSGPQRQLSTVGTSFVVQQQQPQASEQSTDNPQQQGLEHRIPGRTIILQQNKWDMGAHRFTFVEQNVVVAATDLPNSNDRAMNIVNDNNNNNEELSEEEQNLHQQQHEHYSKAHAKTGVYGVEHLYQDRNIAHEEIRIVMDATLFTQQQLTSSMVLE